MKQSNCNAAAQLWHVSVLKEQGRKKKTHPIILQEASKEPGQEPHGESERERKGGNKKSIDNQRRSRRRRKKKAMRFKWSREGWNRYSLLNEGEERRR